MIVIGDYLNEAISTLPDLDLVPVTPMSMMMVDSYNGALLFKNKSTETPLTDGWHTDDEDRKRFYHIRNGRPHSVDDVPAYFYRGAHVSLRWYEDGKRHRLHGPSSVLYRQNEMTLRWCITGDELSFSDWLSTVALPATEKVQLKMVWG